MMLLLGREDVAAGSIDEDRRTPLSYAAEGRPNDLVSERAVDYAKFSKRGMSGCGRAPLPPTAS